MDAIGYIAENIRDIGNEVLYSKARVNLPRTYPKEKFINAFQKDYNIPTAVFKPNPNKSYTTAEILQKAKKFIKKQNLEKKHKIFLNFPSSCRTSHDFMENNMSPSTVVEFNFSGDDCMDPSLRQYYGRRHHRLLIKSDESPPNQEAKDTIDEAMRHMMNILRTTKIPDTPLLKGCYHPRVLIIGRTGSGRRSQANYLVHRFKLTKSEQFNLIILV